MANTVRVRILVAVDCNGNWLGYGWRDARDAEDVKEGMVIDELERGEIYHWIEADVPLPAEAGPAIIGTVTAEEKFKKSALLDLADALTKAEGGTARAAALDILGVILDRHPQALSTALRCLPEGIVG